jgi:hypothetical protein
MAGGSVVLRRAAVIAGVQQSSVGGPSNAGTLALTVQTAACGALHGHAASMSTGMSTAMTAGQQQLRRSLALHLITAAGVLAGVQAQRSSSGAEALVRLAGQLLPGRTSGQGLAVTQQQRRRLTVGLTEGLTVGKQAGSGAGAAAWRLAGVHMHTSMVLLLLLLQHLAACGVLSIMRRNGMNQARSGVGAAGGTQQVLHLFGSPAGPAAGRLMQQKGGQA